jgi:hypothetical protein
MGLVKKRISTVNPKGIDNTQVTTQILKQIAVKKTK